MRRSFLSTFGLAILLYSLVLFRYETTLTTPLPERHSRHVSLSWAISKSSSSSHPTPSTFNTDDDQAPPIPPRLSEMETCAASKSNFRRASGLFVIVTGMEHSGTTLVSEFLMSAPNLFGAFESGFLLDESPSTFYKRRTFYNWSIQPVTKSLHWGLKVSQRKYVTRATCFAEMYRRVHESSPLMQRPNDQSWIVDKTPSYIYNLTHIMEKTPLVPVVVTIKNNADQLRSLTKRGVGRKSALRRMAGGQEALVQARARFPERIITVNVTELQRDPDSVLQNLFGRLHLTWRTDYMSMEYLNKKGRHLGRCQVPAYNTNSTHRGDGPAAKVVGDTCQDNNGNARGKRKGRATKK
eukprot:scaffold5869_cov165-Amphora_coffeaeformis.AAC.11